MMSHPYLNFSDTYGGKKVGTASSGLGSGLTNKSVKVVQIPHSIDSAEVVEIGFQAFAGTRIESVFISKTVTCISDGAFHGCQQLKEVRFETRSNLQKIYGNVFWQCSSLEKIDFPSTLQIIDTRFGGEIFNMVYKLTCISYLGNTDFSAAAVFGITMGSSQISIHVSTSYSGRKFGNKEIQTRNGETCEVSQLPFEPIFPTRTRAEMPKRTSPCQKPYTHVLFLVFIFTF